MPMSASSTYRKIDRHQVFEVISEIIKKSPSGEAEVSSSELADKFDVQAPTMDYHLNKLVQEGKLSILPKRGRYNRKIYRLPSTTQEQEKPKTELHTPFVSVESAEKFKKFLAGHVKKEPQTQDELILENAEETKEDIIEEPEIEIKEAPKVEIKENIQVKNLTLDEQIQHFLQESDKVHDAEALLKHEDREILSVMNETIHQTSVYLKDLSEQLSTVQNKQLIQHLIDDRNRMQEQMNRMEEEVKESRAQLDKTIQKYEVDPARVRFMHQLIIATIDDYMNRPNHAMALGRTDFRNKVSKEISDLVKYVLHLEQ